MEDGLSSGPPVYGKGVKLRFFGRLGSGWKRVLLVLGHVARITFELCRALPYSRTFTWSLPVTRSVVFTPLILTVTVKLPSCSYVWVAEQDWAEVDTEAEEPSPKSMLHLNAPTAPVEEAVKVTL